MFARRVAALGTTAAFVMALALPGWAAPSDNGYVQILSLTNGAEILIDGNFIAEVPYDEYIPLSAGLHKVVVQRRGYSKYEQSLRVKAGQTYELIVDLIAVDGVLKVVTRGLRDATVSVDGDIQGFTPWEGLVPAGEHLLEVAADGYRPFSQPLSVRAGEAYELTVDLQPLLGRKPPATHTPGDSPDPSSDATAATATAGIETTEKTDDTEWYEKWWVWTLVGVGVAGTATALALTLPGDGSSSSPAPFDARPQLPGAMVPALTR